MLCDDTELMIEVIIGHLSGRLPSDHMACFGQVCVSLEHLLFMETIGLQQPQHHLPVGLVCFQKEVLAATNANSSYLPPNAKTLGVFLVPVAPSDPCSGLFSPSHAEDIV